MLSVGSEAGTSDNENALVQAHSAAARKSFNQTGQQVVRRKLNIQPTLTIRPDFPVRVIVNRDLVLAPYRSGGNTMTKLKLGPLADDKPVKLTVELPAAVHRDLVAYARATGANDWHAGPIEPAKLIAPMLERFMATDRVFAKARRVASSNSG